MRLEMRLTQRCADKSSGRRGAPWSRRYSGLAQQIKRIVPMRRETRLESDCAPIRHDAIDTPLQQMHRTKARPELQAQVRVAGKKLRQGWNDVQPPERAWQIDAQASLERDARLHDRRFRLLQICKDARATLVERSTLRRHRDTARRALEQADAEASLQTLHEIADGRFRQLQRIPCLREAAQLDDASKGLQFGQSVHCPRSRTVSLRSARLSPPYAQ